MTPPAAATAFRVSRRNEAAQKWEACTFYDPKTCADLGRFPIPEESTITEFILDRWGSGLYYCPWLDSKNHNLGKSTHERLEDPSRPQKPLRCGVPGTPVAASAPMGAPAPALDIAALLALLSDPKVAPLLAQLQGQQTPSQLEIARIERDRERERREWEERRDRDRREAEEERARAREREERRAEREREEQADQRKRDARRHEIEMEELRHRLSEGGGGIDQDAFEDAIDRVRDELRKEMEQKEQSLLKTIFSVVKDVAPAFLPAIAQAMGRPLPAMPVPMQAPPAAPPLRSTG